MLTNEKKETDEKKAKEFEMRFNMLALTLSLKSNDMHFEIGECYHLLFSTYIKMIENDQDNFFIEAERKEKIIQSLERTKAFYGFESKEQLQTIFETMSDNDPTDFMLFPSEFSSNEDKESDAHICGLTVYKKNEEFLVMKVDKLKSFDGKTVSCFVVPLTRIEELSNLFFEERDFEKLELDSIFKSLKGLSTNTETIPAITMQRQSTGNCLVSEVEASLRTILFNCRTDIFHLNGVKGNYITPKWNSEHQEPTLEMRKRFLSALKGDNDDWNQHFEYIFDYYLYRKGEIVSDSSLANYSSRKEKYRKVRNIFSMDAYIPEMLKNNGQILQTNAPLLAAEIRGIEPIGILFKREIREIDSSVLSSAIERNMNIIEMFKERLDLIKIQRAKDITESIISRLQVKNKELQAELQRRDEIENERQSEGNSIQILDESVTNTVPHKPYSPQPSVDFHMKDSVEKAKLTELIEQSKKTQYEFQSSRQQEENIKKEHTHEWRNSTLTKETDGKMAKEFEKKVVMLALTLSLKENDRFFEAKEGYQLLFSTYIKMIENDQDNFFIEKERKAKIIQSLERTKVFYDFERKEQLQTVFEKMGNDDPADFMLFLSAVSSRKYNTDRIHLCGFTVYKKNEHFLVMEVDKERNFDHEIVTCFKIPSTNSKKLSELFWWERGYVRRGPCNIFKSLKDLSIEVKAIPAITMQYPKMSRFEVSRVEASLRTILFNCRTDIFSLPKAAKVMPKWNSVHADPTVEMRKRFVTAMKGENEAWDQHFDYLFDYYLCRKGKLVNNTSLATRTRDMVRHWEIRNTFDMDAYIPEMLKNSGQISTQSVPLIQGEIRGINPSGMAYMQSIKETSLSNLKNAMKENTYKIKICNERLPFIKIQRAKDITESIISRLQDKNKEIEAEIQRREEIEMARQDKRDSKQPLYQSISNVVSSTHQPIRTRSNRSAKKVRIDDRLEQLKKRQEPKNTRISEETMKVREIRMYDYLDRL